MVFRFKIYKQTTFKEFPLQVSKEEQLPRGVCQACYTLLMKYSEFKQTCLQSQAALIDLEKELKLEIDLKTDCAGNYKLNGSQKDNIKTEIIENAVKLEDCDHHGKVSFCANISRFEEGSWQCLDG